MKYGKGTARRILSVLLALVMCLGMLPGTVSAADGPTEVKGVETGDGKLKVPVMRKAGRASGDKPMVSAADLSYPFDDWDEYTAYAGIAKQAETFISFARAMEGAMAEQYDMLERVRELLEQAANGTNKEVDIDAMFAEIDQIRQEWARLCEDTYGECPEEGAGWYGLRGGSVEFGLPWTASGDGPLLRLELPDMREMFTEQAVSGMRSDMEHGLEIVGGIEAGLAACRSDVGAKLAVANELYNFAEEAGEIQASNRFGTGPFDTLGPDTYDFPDTDPERIFTSSMDNALDLISFVQFFEGGLMAIHSAEQRINECKVRILNDETIGDVDRLGLREEIRQLNLGIRYVMDAASYDGFHFLSEPGKTVTCPLGWKDLCHHEIKLRYDRTWTLGDDPSLEEINDAIDSVGLLRSYLGASQNGLEHIIGFCDYVLTNGPVLGNTFNRDSEGHHTVENPSEAFVKVAGDMMGRISNLTEQMQNGTLTDFDRQSILMEMTTLTDYFDLIVDMVKTEVGGVVAVAEPEHDYTQAITLEKDQSEYKYRIRYSSAMSDVSRVSLVDYLENGDNSVYAGVLTGIGLPADIDPAEMEVYVMLDAIDFTPHDGYGHTTLPDGAWERIDPDTFKDWDRVYGVGVYFGDTVFGPEIGQRPQVDVVLDMKLDMGAKSNSIITGMPAGGYVLKNSIVTCELPGDASEAVRKGSETYTTVTQPLTEANAIGIGSYVTNQVWTDPDTPPTGPEDSPNWGHGCDAPVGSDLYYRTIINFNAVTAQGVLSELGGSSILRSRVVVQHDELVSGSIPARNMVLSCMLGRITPDYGTLEVYKNGEELVAGEDYRLYASGFHMYSDDHDPAHAARISSLMALRDKIQETWWPYYTFGLIFSNDLMPTVSTLAQANQTPQDILQLLRSGGGRIRGSDQGGGNAASVPQYGPDSIVITYKARLDTDAFLVDDDGAGHSMEADGMPVRLATQSNTATLGYSALEKADFEALIGGAGDDGLPRFAGSEDIDVAAIEASGKFPDLDNASENTQDAESNIRDTDMADETAKYDKDDPLSRDGAPSGRMVIQHNSRPGFSRDDGLFTRAANVHSYGFDVAKLDESGKLLRGGTFEIRTGPEDGASAMEFVRVDWMDGTSNEAVFPEGPVYRLAVDGDGPEARTTEIEAGKAIVVGLDSGTYCVVEKEAPSGYLRDAEPHSVKLLSLSDFMAGLKADYAEEMAEFSKNNILAQAGQSMLGQANQVPKLGSGDKIDGAGDDAAGQATVLAQIHGKLNAWHNIVPIQVDGGGIYDLSHLGIAEKVFSAMAFFDKTDDGGYSYGNTSFVLQAGADADRKLQGSEENPLEGGLAVTNLPGLELPKTGGMGTGPYAVLGSATALLSGLLLLRRKRYPAV